MGKKGKNKIQYAETSQGGDVVEVLHEIVSDIGAAEFYSERSDGDAIVESNRRNESREKLSHYIQERLSSSTALLDDTQKIDHTTCEELALMKEDLYFLIYLQDAGARYLDLSAPPTMSDLMMMVNDERFLLSIEDILRPFLKIDIIRELKKVNRSYGQNEMKDLVDRYPRDAEWLLDITREITGKSVETHSKTTTELRRRLGKVPEASDTLPETLPPLHHAESRNRINLWRVLNEEKQGVYTGLTSLRSSRLLFLALATSSEDTFGAGLFVEDLPDCAQKYEILSLADIAIKSLQRGTPQINLIEAATNMADNLWLTERLDPVLAMRILQDTNNMLSGELLLPRELVDSARNLLVEIGEEVFDVDSGSDGSNSRALADKFVPASKKSGKLTEVEKKEREDFFDAFEKVSDNYSRILISMRIVLDNLDSWPGIDQAAQQVIRKFIWMHGLDSQKYLVPDDYGENVNGFGDIANVRSIDPGIALRHILSLRNGALSTTRVYHRNSIELPRPTKYLSDFTESQFKGFPDVDPLIASPFRPEVKRSAAQQLTPTQQLLAKKSSEFVRGDTIYQLSDPLAEIGELGLIGEYPASLSEIIVELKEGESIGQLGQRMYRIEKEFEKVFGRQMSEAVRRFGDDLSGPMSEEYQRELVTNILASQDLNFMRGIVSGVSQSLSIPIELNEKQLEALKNFVLFELNWIYPSLLIPKSEPEKELLKYLLGGRDKEMRRFSSVSSIEWSLDALQREARLIEDQGGGSVSEADLIMLYKRFARVMFLGYESVNSKPVRIKTLPESVFGGMFIGGTAAYYPLQQAAFEDVQRGGRTFNVGDRVMSAILRQGAEIRRIEPLPLAEEQLSLMEQIDELSSEIYALPEIDIASSFLQLVDNMARKERITPLQIPVEAFDDLGRRIAPHLPGISQYTLRNCWIILLSSEEGRKALANFNEYLDSRNKELAHRNDFVNYVDSVWGKLKSMADAHFTASGDEGEFESGLETSGPNVGEQEVDLISNLNHLLKKAEKLLDDMDEMYDPYAIDSYKYKEMAMIREFVQKAKPLVAAERYIKRTYGKNFTTTSTGTLTDENKIPPWVDLLGQLNLATIVRGGMQAAIEERIDIMKVQEVEAYAERMAAIPLFWSMRRIEDIFGDKSKDLLLVLFSSNKIPSYKPDTLLIHLLISEANRKLDLNDMEDVRKVVGALEFRLDIFLEAMEEERLMAEESSDLAEETKVEDTRPTTSGESVLVIPVEASLTKEASVEEEVEPTKGKGAKLGKGQRKKLQKDIHRGEGGRWDSAATKRAINEHHGSRD